MEDKTKNRLDLKWIINENNDVIVMDGDKEKFRMASSILSDPDRIYMLISMEEIDLKEAFYTILKAQIQSGLKQVTYNLNK